MTINYTFYNKKQDKFIFENINSQTLLNLYKDGAAINSHEKITRIGFITDYMQNIVENVVKTILTELDINFEITNLAQEAIELQIMDLQSDIYVHDLDILFIYPDYNKMLKDFYDKNMESSAIASSVSNHWRKIWDILNQKSNLTIIQHDCISDLTNGIGEELISEINIQLKNHSPDNVNWVEISKLSKDADEWTDIKYLDLIRMPFSTKNTMSYFGAMNLVLRSVFKKPIKMVISDLDGVMWDGILAEDGPVLIAKKFDSKNNEHSAGIANVLNELMREGYLISICSKNYLQDFHAVMNLSNKIKFNYDDLVAVECSWEPKPIGVRLILEKIGFSPENVMFIDDSQIECAEMKSHFPKMTVLNIVKQELITRSHFQQLGFFKETKITTEDVNRNSTYKVMNQLEAIENLLIRENFLISLNMQICITPYSKIDSSRINQMFERTNQFRANSQNWNDSKMDSQSNTFKLELSDKYANYGIVAILIYHITDDSLVISNWLMSCRVFGRKLENSFLSKIVEDNTGKKLQYLKIEYEQSNRNSYFLKVCKNLGFTIIEGFLSIEICNLKL